VKAEERTTRWLGRADGYPSTGPLWISTFLRKEGRSERFEVARLGGFDSRSNLWPTSFAPNGTASTESLPRRPTRSSAVCTRRGGRIPTYRRQSWSKPWTASGGPRRATSPPNKRLERSPQIRRAHRPSGQEARVPRLVYRPSRGFGADLRRRGTSRKGSHGVVMWEPEHPVLQGRHGSFEEI
jgi:hypothetical protein